MKCGSLVTASQVFRKLVDQSSLSWTAIIFGHTRAGRGQEALRLYRRMREEGVLPTKHTFVHLLKACGIAADLEEGKRIHAETVKFMLERDLMVGTCLVNMYAKCGSILDAQLVFDRLRHPDAVAWNAMLAGYAQLGHAGKALHLYQRMQEEAVSLDARTFVSALQACSNLAETEATVLVSGQYLKVKCLHEGKALHAEACRRGYELNVFVGSTLISVYGKCGSIVDACNVFDGLPLHDVVSCTAMLTAYVQLGQGEKALQLYGKILEEGVSPDDTMYVCILQACGDIGALDICTKIHHNHVSATRDLSLLLVNALIHTYGKCGRMKQAQYVFDTLLWPDVVSWTALIAGYAREGNSMATMELLEGMLEAGVKPNAVTFISLLSACSHAGLVDKGVDYFESMSRDYGIAPGIEHYVCMVDILGRAGYFGMVESLLSKMEMQPNMSILLCLLGACRKHGNVVLGRKVFDSVIQMQPNYGAAYVLMSNIYSQAGMWDCAEKLDELGQASGAWKYPGRSWIEHGFGVKTFLGGDGRHQQPEQVLEMVLTFNACREA